MYTNYVLSKLMFYQISIKGEKIIEFRLFKQSFKQSKRK